MSPCYSPAEDRALNIDRLAEECYDGARRNGFYDRDNGSVWNNVMDDLQKEIEEANQASTTKEILEELTDCIMVLLGLREVIADEHFAVTEENPSLGRDICAKLAYNKTRGHLHGRQS